MALFFACASKKDTTQQMEALELTKVSVFRPDSTRGHYLQPLAIYCELRAGTNSEDKHIFQNYPSERSLSEFYLVYKIEEGVDSLRLYKPLGSKTYKNQIELKEGLRILLVTDDVELKEKGLDNYDSLLKVAKGVDHVSYCVLDNLQLESNSSDGKVKSIDSILKSRDFVDNLPN